MSISYLVQGRFANNLIQYFAAKVLGRITNKSYVYNIIPDNSRRVGDVYFLDIYKNKDKINIDDNLPEEARRVGFAELSGNILLTEYYQQCDWIMQEKDFLRSLLTSDNEDRINESFKVSDIAKALNNFKHDQRDDELMVHIRLDDYLFQGYNSDIADPYDLVQYINSLGYEYHTLVCDTLRAEWEKKYMQIMSTSLKNSKITNNDLLHDFCTLYYSKNTLSSRSSFSWIACTISPYNYKTYMPLRPFKNYPNQNLDKINRNTINFLPKYLLTTENLV